MKPKRNFFQKASYYEVHKCPISCRNVGWKPLALQSSSPETEETLARRLFADFDALCRCEGLLWLGLEINF